MVLTFPSKVKSNFLNTLNIVSRRFNSQIKEQIPTSSRLTRNAANWQNNYDVNRKGPLSKDQIIHYFEKGYLIVPDFIPQNYLDGCKNDINELVDELVNRLYSKGLIKNKYENEGFYTRLTRIESEFKGASVLLHKLGKLPKSFQDLWTYSKLLDIAQQLLGDNIGGHPVWNLRCKVPSNEESTVPWHQDVGYLDKTSYNTHQLTAWIPLLNVDTIHGALQIIESSHKKGNIATHTACSGNTWYIDLHENIIKNELFENSNIDLNQFIKSIIIKEKSLLLLNNLVAHRSLNNFSNQIRWSLDLRWQNPFLPSGYYGLKECIPFRLKNNSNLKIDWDKWNQQDRHNLSNSRNADHFEDDLDTTIIGPWMDNWELLHKNKHTDVHFKKKEVKNI